MQRSQLEAALMAAAGFTRETRSHPYAGTACSCVIQS